MKGVLMNINLIIYSYKISYIKIKSDLYIAIKALVSYFYSN